VCDQILVSRPLMRAVDGLSILSRLNNQDLLTRDGRPNRKFSDHLPVQLTVNA
jgi:hypothetical protein